MRYLRKRQEWIPDAALKMPDFVIARTTPKAWDEAISYISSDASGWKSPDGARAIEPGFPHDFLKQHHIRKIVFGDFYDKIEGCGY